MIQTLADNVWKNYYEELAKVDVKPTPEQQTAISKALLGNMPTLEGLQKSFINVTPATEPKDFSIWRLLGLDPDDEENQDMIDAVKDSVSKIGDALNEALEQRVEIAQRERELLDTKISETQREVELEAGLQKEGFANNLTARQTYLNQLKKQRDQALIDEEKAIKQEQLLAKITQTTNILSGVSNIIETFTKIPIVGIILAAAAVASLWAIWGGAKSRVATETELAEGGSGTETGLITGKRHSEGGERFLDHVEVERGEAFGVLSRPATERYGKVFHEMVSSFNKDEMPEFITPTMSNNVRVENSGPNSRLDKVIKEQRRLNDSILKQSQLYSVGGKRIERKGNKVRITG